MTSAHAAIITKPISTDIPSQQATYPWTGAPIEVPPVLKNKTYNNSLRSKVEYFSTYVVDNTMYVKTSVGKIHITS